MFSTKAFLARKSFTSPRELASIVRAIRAGGLAFLLLAATQSNRAFAGENKASTSGDTPRVLIITGQGDHDWRATAPFLRRILVDSGRFDVRVCETPKELTSATFADFDILVDDCGASASDRETGKAIARFVQSGKGLVVTHGALSCCTGVRSPAGDKQEPPSGRSGTVPDYWPAYPSISSPPTVRFLDVKITQPGHPIVQGFNGEAKIADAVYREMTVRPGAEVIATIVASSGSGETVEAPALIASGYGRGRVFCTTLGHDLAAMQEAVFITTFARAAEWAATGKVTLPPDLGPPRPSPTAVKGLLITGGHDHETAFYTLFEGYKDLAWLPVASSTTAFQNDLRKKYDVLIMYDFSRDLDDKGKKNLREFVESGKGVVVLHHALLNYQHWPWWSEEVVGGRYRLQREGSAPSSTVKDSQHIFVNLATEHPVTKGLSPFHIVDETYKGMWFSPRIKSILTTDNPNSDHSLAWIGPCASSRVIAIQLGHGHTAFGHPSYRELVHRAILWSAGRIAQEKKRNLLFIGQSKGYQHESISTAMVTLFNLGRSSGQWDTYFRTDCTAITKKPLKYGAKNLDAFDAVVFFTDGDLDMDDAQKADLLSFLRDDGKGFIGIHSATITFPSWPEYGKMIGGSFDGHPWGEFDAPLLVEDAGFPGMGHLPRPFSLKDEIYQIKNFSRDNVRVLLRLDAAKLDLSKRGVHKKDNDFAVIWARNYGKGRVLYNGLGHRREIWDRPDIQRMWLETVEWAMGILPGDAAPRPAP